MNALQTLSPDAPTDTLLLSDDEWSLLATAIEYPICQLICAEVEMPRQIDEAERRLRVLAGSRKVKVLRLADFKDDAEAALAAAREASQPSDQPHAAPALILIRDDEWSVGTLLPEDELRRVRFWRVMNLLRESWHAIPAQIVFFLSPPSYRALTTHADHLKRWVALKLHFRAITKSPHSTSSLELDPGWDRPGNTLLQVNLETARQQLQFLPRVLEEAMQRGDSQEVITRRYRMPLFLAAVTANEYVLAKQLRDQIPLDILRPEEHRRWLEANAELELATGNPTAVLSLARELRQRSTDSKDRKGEVMAVILSARALARVGETASAEEELKEAVRTLGSLDDSILVELKAERADVLQARGQLDEALRIRREEQLPVYERLGDVRERAVTLGKIADVLQARGQLDEALRIRRDEELPVYERLGDVRSRAITLGKIADVLEARVQLDEALRIRRDEELPVYERLGDVRSRAVTLGQIADVLEARGQLDEALRIRREEELPVYERLGDVRERAVTLGKIADVLQARGQLDEALRIRRDEQLPVYERLGDVRSLIVCRAKLALGLLSRGHPEDAPEARDHLLWSYQEAKARGYSEVPQLEQILRQHGVLPPSELQQPVA